MVDDNFSGSGTRNMMVAPTAPRNVDPLAFGGDFAAIWFRCARSIFPRGIRPTGVDPSFRVEPLVSAEPDETPADINLEYERFCWGARVPTRAIRAVRLFVRRCEREATRSKQLNTDGDRKIEEMTLLARLVTVAEFCEDAAGIHARRVGDMVRNICIEIGYTSEAAELCGNAAVLHDLGKVGVPDAILSKPAKVSADEFEVIKTHTRVGGMLLSGSQHPLLIAAEEIARFHHERWDGTGYEGLVGEAIPVGARITAVADVFDALISVRPYKNAMSVQAAIEEIEKCSGTHFDPQVVAAFLRVISNSFAVA